MSHAKQSWGTEISRSWLQLARRPSIVRRASVVAVVVGGFLVVLNHYDALLSGHISLRQAVQMVVTVLVPYCVSTYSSVNALRERRVGPLCDASDTLDSAPRAVDQQ